MLGSMAEFRRLCSRRTIQKRWHLRVRSLRFPHQLCLHWDIRLGAQRKHVCKLAAQICTERLELARFLCGRDVIRGFRAVRYPRLVGTADAGLPNRAALRAGARADEDVLCHHRLPLPDDERLCDIDHRSEHM
jgi:hypothetical protein